MHFRESRTIKAIGELRASFPYAAALLSYVVVERVLKRYALDHWSDPLLARAKIPGRVKPYGGKALSQLGHLTRTQRLHGILCEMTFGEIETLLRRPESERSASDRNEVVHSNLYLKAESTLPKSKQQALNPLGSPEPSVISRVLLISSRASQLLRGEAGLPCTS